VERIEFIQNIEQLGNVDRIALVHDIEVDNAQGGTMKLCAAPRTTMKRTCPPFTGT
jgi:hypothetical protein